MKLILNFLLICTTLLLLSACNSIDRFSILKQCTVLGDESIIYARAHYVKLFYHFNPDKFIEPYSQIENFDAVTHKNTIDTYYRAIERLVNNKQNIEDQTTLNLLAACKELSSFTKEFVEESYPKAIIYTSDNSPLTDNFFIEINQIVKFDHNIGVFNDSNNSFKHKVNNYQKAVKEYITQYRKTIPSEFVNQRVSRN